MKLIFIYSTFFLLCCNLSHAENKKVFCYWVNFLREKSEENIDPTLCTHIFNYFAKIDNETFEILPSASKERILNRTATLKMSNPNLKFLSTIGFLEGASTFSRISSNATRRSKFIQDIVKFLRDFKLDGVDIDWEFPICWDDCKLEHYADRENCNILLKELREAFDKTSQKLLLTFPVSAEEWIISRSYDIKVIAKYADYINLMTYDHNLYPEPPNKVTKVVHHSPFEWTKEMAQFFLQNGVLMEKLVVGLPIYGHRFTLANKTNHSLGAPAEPNWKASGSFIDYSEACRNVKNVGWKKEMTKDGPLAYKGDQLVCYDDPNQTYLKAKWLKDNKFGAVFLLQLSSDDIHTKCCNVSTPGLRAANFGFRDIGQHPKNYGCE